jgi:hypothetical protein
MGGYLTLLTITVNEAEMSVDFTSTYPKPKHHKANQRQMT